MTTPLLYNKLIFLVAILICAPSAAVEWDVTLNPVPRAGMRPDEYGLRGVWPNSCVPQLVTVKSVAAENTNNIIHLLTKSEQSNCNPNPSPFLLIFQLPDNIASYPELYWLHQHDEAQNARLLGFKLLSLSTIQADIRPASGWWWPETGELQDSGPGTGLTVDYQNGLLTLITESFNSAGQPEWLLGTAPLKQGVSNTELIKFTNGQSLTGNYQAPLIDNSRNAIHIRFLSASRAQVWLETRAGSGLEHPINLRELTMVRYFMDPPILERLLNGSWLVVPEDSPEYASQANQFRISKTEIHEFEATLHTVDGSNIGQCKLRPGKPDSPPHQCLIQLQSGEKTEEWTFTSFSLERMRGHNKLGNRITAFKLNPN